MFAAWWLSRATTSYIVSTGFWHWAMATVVFFIFIAIALALMGKIGSGEFRGKMLVREVIAGLIALVVVFLWGQGVIHMSGSASARPLPPEATMSK
jgi:VIT1/CCC1 family predicted Fe2+/Mn2+ transporter